MAPNELREKTSANPLAVLREEADDWAMLFDPDTGKAFGRNPVGVFICQRLDGRHSVADIVKELKPTCKDVPEEAEAHVQEFIDDLTSEYWSRF